MQMSQLTFMVTYMRTGRKSSAPGGFSFAETEVKRLLITLQQLRIHTSLSLGALYIFIFWSSFCASCQNVACSERVRHLIAQWHSRKIYAYFWRGERAMLILIEITTQRDCIKRTFLFFKKSVLQYCENTLNLFIFGK